MSEEKKDVTRREALKSLAVGVGVSVSLPVLGANIHAHDHEHGAHQAAKAAPAKGQFKPKFFNAHQNATVIALSEIIIPADDHSPGAKAANVNEFIDLMVSESPERVKQEWTEGLAVVDKLSQAKFGKTYVDATAAQQIELLTEISKNERNPQLPEEKFFRTVKNMTIDGYYTSEIGIHQELKYKGNTYLKEFKGCTHPEHQA